MPRGPMTHIRNDHDISFLNTFDEGIVACESDGTIAFFNRAAERIFGHAAEAVLGQPLELLIPAASRDRHRHYVEAFRISAKSSRMMSERGAVQGLRRDGTVFDAEISISKATFAGRTMLTAVVRDVSEGKQVERELRAAEERHRAILDTCSDGIVLADAVSGLIVDANDRAAEMFGCAVDELVGLHQSVLHPAADRERYARIFREHVEDGRILVSDANIQRRDGEILPVEITAKPTEIDGAAMLVGFFRNISHRKERERLLIEARREAERANEEKTKFLASVSHELRTPLNGIIGLSDLIRTEVYGAIGNDRYREYLDDINHAGTQLLGMINELLDLSRIEAGRFEPQDEDIDIAAAVEEATSSIRPLSDKAGLRLEIAVAGVPVLRADRRAVYQMLVNLLSNATKFTPEGGRIRIEGTVAPDGGVVLTVADTGCGIAADKLAQVTTPFNADGETRIKNQPNLGLGLSITKGLIEGHGGRLEIESAEGLGTSVHLAFPPHRTGTPSGAETGGEVA